MIRLERVCKRFAGTSEPAVNELTMDIRRGETTVLVGPSGCGKTTTMKMINRLVEPTSGSILLDGENIQDRDPVELRRRIGYVIQTVGLLPHRRVGENIATVPALLGWSRQRIQARVGALAELFELDPALLGRYPAELSGGQRQRVGVARALAADPPVMLMDEPFGAVDPVVRGRLQEQFLKIQRELKKTIVFVTHDIDEACLMADRIALLNVGGVLEQLAPPAEVLSRPASDFVAGFVGMERGLKRLALLSAASADPHPGPQIEVGATVTEARDRLDRSGSRWAGVVDGDAFVAIATRDNLASAGELRDLAGGRRVVCATDTLRTALDAAIGSADGLVAVVAEDGRYLGALSVDAIGRQLRASKDPARTGP